MGFLGMGSLAILPTNVSAGDVNVWNVWATTAWDFWNLTDVQGLGLAWAKDASRWNASFIDIVKNFINRVLWILGLISLVILLYGWFNMVTAAGDEEKYNKWFKILKQAAMWLAFIGLAFFMVSIIFWLLGTVAGGDWVTA